MVPPPRSHRLTAFDGRRRAGAERGSNIYDAFEVMLYLEIYCISMYIYILYIYIWYIYVYIYIQIYIYIDTYISIDIHIYRYMVYSGIG